MAGQERDSKTRTQDSKRGDRPARLFDKKQSRRRGLGSAMVLLVALALVAHAPGSALCRPCYAEDLIS